MKDFLSLKQFPAFNFKTGFYGSDLINTYRTIKTNVDLIFSILKDEKMDGTLNQSIYDEARRKSDAHYCDGTRCSKVDPLNKLVDLILAENILFLNNIQSLFGGAVSSDSDHGRGGWTANKETRKATYDPRYATQSPIVIQSNKYFTGDSVGTALNAANFMTKINEYVTKTITEDTTAAEAAEKAWEETQKLQIRGMLLKSIDLLLIFKKSQDPSTKGRFLKYYQSMPRLFLKEFSGEYLENFTNLAKTILINKIYMIMILQSKLLNNIIISNANWQNNNNLLNKIIQITQDKAIADDEVKGDDTAVKETSWFPFAFGEKPKQTSEEAAASKLLAIAAPVQGITPDNISKLFNYIFLSTINNQYRYYTDIILTDDYFNEIITITTFDLLTNISQNVFCNSTNNFQDIDADYKMSSIYNTSFKISKPFDDKGNIIQDNIIRKMSKCLNDKDNTNCALRASSYMFSNVLEHAVTGFIKKIPFLPDIDLGAIPGLAGLNPLSFFSELMGSGLYEDGIVCNLLCELTDDDYFITTNIKSFYIELPRLANQNANPVGTNRTGFDRKYFVDSQAAIAAFATSPTGKIAADFAARVRAQAKDRDSDEFYEAEIPDLNPILETSIKKFKDGSTMKNLLLQAGKYILKQEIEKISEKGGWAYDQNFINLAKSIEKTPGVDQLPSDLRQAFEMAAQAENWKAVAEDLRKRQGSGGGLTKKKGRTRKGKKGKNTLKNHRKKRY